MTPAEQIATKVLESHASAYWALHPSQHVARAKVVASAANAIKPILDQLLLQHARDVCAANLS